MVAQHSPPPPCIHTASDEIEADWGLGMRLEHPLIEHFQHVITTPYTRNKPCHLGVQLVQYIISSICDINQKTQVSVYVAVLLTCVAMTFCPIQHILEAL